MTYLVKYTDDISRPGIFSSSSIDKVENWEIIDEVCDGNSLLDINPYLKNKEYPILNDLTNFRINGITLVYFICLTEQIYILDSTHKNCISIVRDYKLKNLLK